MIGFRQSNQCMGVLQSKRRCTISHDDRRGAPEARRPLCETHAEASWAGRSPARPCREPPTLQINYMFVPVVSSKRPNQYMCGMLASRASRWARTGLRGQLVRLPTRPPARLPCVSATCSDTSRDMNTSPGLHPYALQAISRTLPHQHSRPFLEIP